MQSNASGHLPHEIAIVGMSCRFPGAGSITEFWDLLTNGFDAVQDVPFDRFDVAAVFHPTPGTADRTVSRHGGFVDDAFGFDAAFFGIAPVEARGMDPQQRLLLTTAWEALENAGIRPSTLAGSRGGVFVGQATAEYGEQQQDPSDVRQAAGSRLRAVTSGRLSYALDLRGPSMTIDTACSSSLVAVHLARQSLMTNECDIALAAGVNIVLSPTDSVTYSQAGMLSPGGRCRFGDAAADGFVRSEGIGVVILKRLADAQRDGDAVLAVLVGSAVNNDGQGSELLLQPAVSGQIALLQQACASAGMRPSDLDYLEAHGTGTTVGDGVELRAISAAMNGARSADRPLWVGSVKSNIGHTEAAAGIAGLIKAVLIAQNRTIPASLHVSHPHPALTDQAVRIPTSTRALVPARTRAVIGVSSFGIAGTNAHVIVAEAPARTPVAATGRPQDGPQLLLLSAQSRSSLHTLAARFADHLEMADTDTALSAFCAAAATRRDHHRYRAWAVASTHAEMVDALRALAADEPFPMTGTGQATRNRPQTAFVFAGQGSQWVGMARDLLTAEPAFRAAIEQCDATVHSELGWSVIECLASAEATPTDISIVQPLLWSIQVGLLALWRSWGVEADLCVGHSMGEAAAAFASGALSLPDAAAVICRRSRLLKRISGFGSMLATGLDLPTASSLVEQQGGLVSIAAENSPTMTLLAGDPMAIEEISKRLETAGVFARHVQADVASHSPYTEELRSDLLDELRALQPVNNHIPLVSTVTGTPIAGAALTAEYWMRNLRNPVLFASAVRQILTNSEDCLFIELSPHPVLVAAIKEIQSEHGTRPAAITSLLRGVDERASLAAALGEIFARGAAADWNSYFGTASADIEMPTYAWDLEEFRGDTYVRTTEQTRLTQIVDAPLDRSAAGIRAAGTRPIPPMTFVHSALAAVRESNPGIDVDLIDIRLHTTVDADDPSLTTIRTTLDPKTDGGWSVSVAVHSIDPSVPPQTCLTASLRRRNIRIENVQLTVDDLLSDCSTYTSRDALRARLSEHGHVVTTDFLLPQRVWSSDTAAVGHVRGHNQGPTALLEACLQHLFVLVPVSSSVVPTDIADAYVAMDSAFDRRTEFWSVIQVHNLDKARIRLDVTVLADDGTVLAQFRQLDLRQLPTEWPTTPTTNAMPEHEPMPSVDLRTPVEVLVRHAAEVLGTTPQRLDHNRSLRDHGLDSLMALDLSKRIGRTRSSLTVSPGRLLSAETITELATTPDSPSRNEISSRTTASPEPMTLSPGLSDPRLDVSLIPR